MAKQVIKQPPENLYIADPKERLIEFFAEEMFKQLIEEVESEETRLTDEA